MTLQILIYGTVFLQKERLCDANDKNLTPILSKEYIIELVLDLGILDDEQDDKWNKILKDYYEFYIENNHHPNRTSSNAYERKLRHFYDENTSRLRQKNRCARIQKLKLFGFDKIKVTDTNTPTTTTAKSKKEARQEISPKHAASARSKRRKLSLLEDDMSVEIICTKSPSSKKEADVTK